MPFDSLRFFGEKFWRLLNTSENCTHFVQNVATLSKYKMEIGCTKLYIKLESLKCSYGV